jgi:catechol-2,3-dioxygenase
MNGKYMAKDQINRINTILYCRRWAQIVGFYRKVLGLAVHLETDWFVEFKVADGAFLSIADEARATVKSAGGAGVTLSFQVADAATWHKRLEGRDIEVGLVRRHWNADAFFFRDPEGHRIEIWSPAPEGPGPIH